jgi:hypothetical protein
VALGNRPLVAFDADPRSARLKKLRWQKHPVPLRRVIFFGKGSRSSRLRVVVRKRYFRQPDLEFPPLPTMIAVTAC